MYLQIIQYILNKTQTHNIFDPISIYLNIAKFFLV